MIDKKLYYFWNTEELPEKDKICLETWKICMPDFEIERIPLSYVDENLKWNKKALKDNKWAYISDQARINFLRSHSGIYLDTDMFMIKPVPEKILNYDFVFEREPLKFFNDTFNFNNAFILRSKTQLADKIIEEWNNYYINFKGRKNKWPSIILPTLIDKLNISEKTHNIFYTHPSFSEGFYMVNRWGNDKEISNSEIYLNDDSIMVHFNNSFEDFCQKNVSIFEKYLMNFFNSQKIDKKIISLYKEYIKEYRKNHDFEEW